MALPEESWPGPRDPDRPDHADHPAPTARVVRAYTLTAGRTRPPVDLPVEATLRRQEAVADVPAGGHLARILDVCDTRSVAEVSALVELPIGVVRVLLGDLVAQGHVRVQATLNDDSTYDERRDLIERTLRGLRTL